LACREPRREHFGQAGLAEELKRAGDAAGLDPLDGQPLAHVLADGQDESRPALHAVPATI